MKEREAVTETKRSEESPILLDPDLASLSQDTSETPTRHSEHDKTSDLPATADVMELAESSLLLSEPLTNHADDNSDLMPVDVARKPDLARDIRVFYIHTEMPIVAFLSLLREKISSDKMLPPVGIEPETLIASDFKSNTILSILSLAFFCFT